MYLFLPCVEILCASRCDYVIQVEVTQDLIEEIAFHKLHFMATPFFEVEAPAAMVWSHEDFNVYCSCVEDAGVRLPVWKKVWAARNSVDIVSDAAPLYPVWEGYQNIGRKALGFSAEGAWFQFYYDGVVPSFMKGVLPKNLKDYL